MRTIPIIQTGQQTPPPPADLLGGPNTAGALLVGWGRSLLVLLVGCGVWWGVILVGDLGVVSRGWGM